MKKQRSALVIGAGPGGLASAMLLARAGVDVKIIERLPRVGGRCSTLKACPADRDPHDSAPFQFDMGPTFFLYPGVLEEIFAACGMDLHEAVQLVRLDPQYRLIFETGGELHCTPEIEKMRQQIAAISPGDAANFERYIAENRKKFSAFTPILQSAFSSWRDVINFDMLKLLPLVRPWRSVDSDLARFFKDPRIRLAFSFQSKYLGMSPFQCPSLFTILSYLEYDYGVYHPIGGCGAVSTAMARAAESLGATISIEEEVREVLFEGKKAVGVRTSCGEYRADAVVINADFAHAMKNLVPDRLRNRWTDRKLERKKYSCSTFMMYLGIDGVYDKLAHHNIFLAKDYQKNLHEIENEHVVSDEPSVYVQNACVTDPALAPDGCSSLYVLAPVTHEHGNVDWAQRTPSFRAAVIRQMEKFGITDLEDRIRYEKVLTPTGWVSDMHIFKGATFNLAHNLTQMLHLRPRNRFEDLDGVYLVGGGTHPGSGLPVIYESARITSRLLMEDLGVEVPQTPPVKAAPKLVPTPTTAALAAS